MERLRRSRFLLVLVYTLVIFLAGTVTTGLWLSAQGYDVPWIEETANAAEQQEQIRPVSAVSESVFGSDIIERIVEQAGPAVVKIETKVQVQNQYSNPFNDPFFRWFFGDQFNIQPSPRVQNGLGSGFIISKDGYILTNNHVVAGAVEVKVYLTKRAEPYDAKVVGSDAELDLAVLKIEAGNNLPILKLGDSNAAKVGSWVIAIGNPYGLDHTVTVGVISAKGRPVYIDGREFKDLIQTDASINPGNSGGPLLNLKGEVVGINTAINAQAQGIGFAIPSFTVQQVLDQLLEEGKVSRPWLGIIMQPVTKELAEYFGLEKAEGALISAVQENSPAEKAGLQRGDIVLEFNGKPIKEPSDLQKAVNETKIGEDVVLLVHRLNKTVYESVKIGTR
jgi:serine protease Do